MGTVIGAAAKNACVKNNAFAVVQLDFSVKDLTAVKRPTVDAIVDLYCVIVVIEGGRIASAMGGIGAVVFQNKAVMVGVPHTSDVHIVTAAIDAADVIFAKHAVHHLRIFASIIEIRAAIIVVKSGVCNLQLLIEFPLFGGAVGGHRFAVKAV